MIYEILRPMYERAKAEKKWFYCSYQELWFAPDELAKLNSEGRFIWGPLNWELRNPNEAIGEIETAIHALVARKALIASKIIQWKESLESHN